MKIKPELKILEAMNKRLERIELTQYLILNSLIQEIKPSKEERKMIEEALKDKNWVEMRKLLKVLRK
mgnify:CR=1 FL=1